jgi:hypothetical protein
VSAQKEPSAPKDPHDEPGEDSSSPFAEIKYSLPELLRDVKIDRSSSQFSMEKLDQDTISRLFEQHNPPRAPSRRKK